MGEASYEVANYQHIFVVVVVVQCDGVVVAVFLTVMDDAVNLMVDAHYHEELDVQKFYYCWKPLDEELHVQKFYYCWKPLDCYYPSHDQFDLWMTVLDLSNSDFLVLSDGNQVEHSALPFHLPHPFVP